jgi:hypothetical protein
MNPSRDLLSYLFVSRQLTLRKSTAMVSVQTLRALSMVEYPQHRRTLMMFGCDVSFPDHGQSDEHIERLLVDVEHRILLP